MSPGLKYLAGGLGGRSGDGGDASPPPLGVGGCLLGFRTMVMPGFSIVGGACTLPVARFSILHGSVWTYIFSYAFENPLLVCSVESRSTRTTARLGPDELRQPD